MTESYGKRLGSARVVERDKYYAATSSTTARGSSPRNATVKRKRKWKIFSVRNGMDMPFFLLLMLLCGIGIIMMFSASFPLAYYNSGNSHYYLERQLAFLAMGIAIMLLISRIDYHVLHKLNFIALAGTMILLVVVLFIPSSDDIHRWIPLGPINLQPSELLKFSMILFIAHWASVHTTDEMRTFKKGVLPVLLIYVPSVVLLYEEPHFSAIVLVTLLTVVMLFIAGIPLKWFAAAGVVGAVGGIAAYMTGILKYAMERLEGWGLALDPPDELYWTTWQTRNSLYAIGSGGFWGLGLGNSRQKYLYLPEPQNDFIFAIICEELGFFGAILILLLFAVFIWRGITISLRAKDKFGMLLGVGLTAQIGLQVIINILVITDWLPNTGISLPFFSYGGSSLMMLLAQMGIVLSISRSANINKT